MGNASLTQKLRQLSVHTRAYLGVFEDGPVIPFALVIPHVVTMSALSLEVLQMYSLTELHGGAKPLSEEEQGQIGVLRERSEQGALRADTMAYACIRRVDEILSRPAPSFDEIRGVLGTWEDYQALVSQP